MKNANKLSTALIMGLMLLTAHSSFGQEKNVLPANEHEPPPARVLDTDENEIAPALKIGFYPNPCRDVLTIELANQEPFQNDMVDIYSLTGTRVWNGTINQKKTINVSDLKPGFYILSCKGASYKFQKA